MTQEGFKRRLAAILSADVKGYSRMMRDDEDSTIRTLTNYRSAISNLIQKFRGYVVDATGDNLLAKFASVVDGVNCAVEIQRELAERNADLPEERKMDFRIGLNLGDVVEEEGRIYGDGVNIAARMEGLAEAGGVCISGSVYDSVESKLGLEYEFLGEKEVKNIDKSVRAYRVLSFPGAAAHRIVQAKEAVGKKWRHLAILAAAVLVVVVAGAIIWNNYLRSPTVEKASVEKMAFPLPDKPSIAVLPFVNMSDDPKQEYFSDGITEHIITSLSKVPYIFVIARNSTFAYKGKHVKIQQIAEELAVRYVLEGSVQRSDDRIRITVQLIDAITGYHLWAENYDRKLKDIFALQDEIAMKIMAELQVKLTDADLGRFASIKTTNLKAYEKWLKGSEHLGRRTESDVLEARRLAQEAIALDPEYGAAYRLLSWTHLDDVWFYRTKDRAKSLQTAEQLAQKATDLPGQNADHSLLSCIFLLREQYEKAIVEAQKAVEIVPNSAFTNFIYGLVLKGAERYDEAIPVLKKAIRLNPVTPIHYLNNLAWSYAYTEQYEKAIPLWNRTIERNPDYLFAYLGLTCAYQLTGNEIKARESAAEVLRIKPTFSIALIEKRKGRIFEAYRKAGLPEHSSQKVSD
jgi:TolB-like protein/class 3 adenylate cyclase